MKIIYSELQKFLPDLHQDPQTLRDDITLIGHFTNFYEQIEDEIVFDLDIKVNRPDVLGYYGLARDLSVYYNIPLIIPPNDVTLNATKESLPIKISSPDVLRLQALGLSDIKNLESPSWLQKVLRLHSINSINALVDLTNYAMLVWSIPNHAFDIAKTSSKLIWKNIASPAEFTTLDGTKLSLKPGNLIICNHQKNLSLSFIGGQNSGIDGATTETIVEMAVYDPSRVRSDWRSLKTVTEAAIRLEKQLDPDSIPLAFNHLIKLIQAITGATVSSSLFDYYPHPITLPAINFNLNEPSAVAGISIPTEFALDCLTRLGCSVIPSAIEESRFCVTPPSLRHDITAAEDLTEEVIRFWGYQKIPTTQPLAAKNYPNITPKILMLVDELKDKLVALGYDEVLTWPLVGTPMDNKAIKTQNSINSEYPYLRQNISQTLAGQVDQYHRLKLVNIQIFEIGKVFFTDDKNNLTEKYALGVYHSDLSQLQKDMTGLDLAVTYNGNYAEIILDDLLKPDAYLPQNIDNDAVELTGQLITLDANISFDQPQNPQDLVHDYSQKIGKNLWQLVIKDEYLDPATNQYRYTLAATYFNLDAKTAKDIHAQTFDLK